MVIQPLLLGTSHGVPLVRQGTDHERQILPIKPSLGARPVVVGLSIMVRAWCGCTLQNLPFTLNPPLAGFTFSSHDCSKTRSIVHVFFGEDTKSATTQNHSQKNPKGE